MDISGLLKNTGVALEAQAYRAFGAAVNDKVGGLLSGVLGSKSVGKILQDVNPVVQGPTTRGVFDTNNYAAQIALGSHGFDPKSKFLFRVTIQFDPKAAEQASSLGVDANSLLRRNLSFIIKSIDMPKYEFEYEEFNYYNFRTKILKRIKHTPLNFKMYDDVANTAIKFLRVYLEILQPVTRRTWDTGTSLEGNGFAFDPAMRGIDTSHRAAIGINGDAKNILSAIVIDQFYLDRSFRNGPANRAIRVNTFTFTNPRLDSFDIDDHDFENGSDPHLVSCTFDYDTLNIVEGKYAEDEDASAYEELDINVGGGSSGGLRAYGRGPELAAGGGGNSLSPFTSIIANQGGRMVQTAITNALYKSGMGKVAGGALSGAISNIAGALGTSAARTLSIAGKGIASGIFAPKAPPVSDGTSGGRVTGRVGG